MAITRVGRLRLFWSSAFLLVVASCVLACYLPQRFWLDDASARRWRQHLASMSEEDAADYLLAHAGESIDPALLVGALGSERPLVVFAARDLLMETFQRWQLEPASHTSPHAAEVAQLLARRAPSWPSHAQEAASQLAVQLLYWSTDDTVIDEERFISDCESVLRLRVQSQPESQVALASSEGAVVEVAPTYLPDSYLPGELYAKWRDIDMPPSEQQFELPGGNLPVNVLPELSPEPRLASNPLPQPAAATAPTPAPSPADMRSGADPPVGQLATNQIVAPSQLIPRPARRIDQDPDSQPKVVQPYATGRSSNLSSSPLRELEHIELMERLHADDPLVTRAARGELSRRGYRPVHIELGRQMTDPSSAVRKRLAENLPEIPNVNALPWLQHLAGDDDPDVRLTALGILATSSDPDTLRWVRDAVRTESDDRVSERLQHMIQR